MQYIYWLCIFVHVHVPIIAEVGSFFLKHMSHVQQSISVHWIRPMYLTHVCTKLLHMVSYIPQSQTLLSAALFW